MHGPEARLIAKRPRPPRPRRDRATSADASREEAPQVHPGTEEANGARSERPPESPTPETVEVNASAPVDPESHVDAGQGDERTDAPPPEPPLVIRRVRPTDFEGGEIDGEIAEAASSAPVDPYRPLTLRETLDLMQDNLRRLEGTWRGTGLTILGVALMGALTWGLVSVVLPWSGGIVETVQATLTLDVGWPAIPAPDDPRVHRSTSLVAAAWVGAPLVLGVFWFTAAYHLDRASRRAFRVVDEGLVRQTAGYTVMAIGVIFPLIILGLAGSAWGVFALITWAAEGEAWATAGTLVGLLVGFAVVVRAANAVLDRRFGG